jgi:predicted DNA-binding protein
MEKKLNKQFGIRLGEGQIKNLKEIARLEFRSLSDIVREFIDTGLEKRNDDSRNRLPVSLCKKS